jgi:hypothetical protein
LTDGVNHWVKHVPAFLVDDLRKRRFPIFFLGSGFGREALPALPTGGDLASSLIAELRVEDGHTGLAELLQYLKNANANSAQSVSEWLKERLFHSGATIASPGGAYYLLLSLRTREILTTNYDLLLRRAAPDALKPDDWKEAVSVADYQRMLQRYPSATVCGYVHGSFDESGLATLIATTDDYITLFRQSRWLKYLSQRFQTTSCVFIGYSLRDFTTWTSFISAIFSDPKRIPPHVMVSPSGSEHERDFWQKYNIKHVPLKAYQFLIALHEQLGTLNNNAAPAAAAASLKCSLMDAERRLTEVSTSMHYTQPIDAAHHIIRESHVR